MKGFSLVEVLVSGVILTLMIAGIYSVLHTGTVTYTIDVTYVEMQQQARQALDWMLRELRGATTKTIGTGNTSITFSTLSLANVQYYRVGDRAIREYPSLSTRVLAHNITGLTFCCGTNCAENCADSNLVEISVTASKAVRDQTVSFPLKGQVRLRNE
jgi:Tfp pilus assembly protein PilV